MAQSWRNRIVGYGTEAPDQLVAHPSNWRIHPAAQTDALGGVLREVGIVQNVIVNRVTGFVVDGHARIMLALRAGQPTIPVTYVELTEAEEALILATLDPIAAMAGADAAALGQLLADVETDDAAIRALLEQVAQDVGLPALDAPPPGGGGDDFDTSTDDGPTRAQLGDLWVIGGVHRLIVGDSTDPEVVTRLLGGEQPGALVSDPPYGIEYHSNRPAWHAARKIEPAFGSDVLDTSWLPMWVNALDVNATAYIFTRWDVLQMWREAMTNAGLNVRQRLIWNKCHWTMGNLEYYGSQVEDILFGTKGSPTLSWDKRRGNLLEAVGVTFFPEGRDGHATQKPLGSVAPWLRDAVPDGGLVVDPFLGSGTTLIAAHRTGRRCYGVELNPRYADIILRRAEAEGLTVVRVDPAE